MFRHASALAAGFCAAAIIGTNPVLAAEHIPPYISAAVADPSRPAEDRQRDDNRKPAETIQFAGIKPGEHVAELIPGKGYFTRILSKVVGPTGHVYAVSPPRRPNAPPDSPDPSAATSAIASDPHYSNVSVEVVALAQVKLPAPVDVIWTSQNYHDVHNVPNIDMTAFNKSVFEALKPGGFYIVLDHAAATGSGARDTSTLHRIDPQIVKKEVEAAGFVLAGESKVLHNSEDAHALAVFDPSIRGKTDQFLLKFRKPRQ
jgi:predicted methyltransferase